MAPAAVAALLSNGEDMTNFARIVGNRAVDVVPGEINGVPLSERYHHSLVSQFVEVPENVQAGWWHWNGRWSDTVPPELDPALSL